MSECTFKKGDTDPCPSCPRSVMALYKCGILKDTLKEAEDSLKTKTWTVPKPKTWAVSEGDLERAWFRYSRNKGNMPDKFRYAFAQGWLAAGGLDPDYNMIEFVK